jgi:hypothetical protein
MKKLILLFIPILILNNLYSQKVEIKNDSAEYKLDFTNPISVVNALIFAAKTKNIELASLVFDPFAQSGQMTKNKTLYLTMDKKRIDQLYEIRDSFINGKFIITGFGDTGYVPMWLKTPSEERQETVHFRKRFGNWYISSL